MSPTLHRQPVTDGPETTIGTRISSPVQCLVILFGRHSSTDARPMLMSFTNIFENRLRRGLRLITAKNSQSCCFPQEPRILGDRLLVNVEWPSASDLADSEARVETAAGDSESIDASKSSEQIAETDKPDAEETPTAKLDKLHHGSAETSGSRRSGCRHTSRMDGIQCSTAGRRDGYSSR